MATEWFYEYGGKKIGPVPPDTLRHLAEHGAISPTTNVWKSGMDTPVPASRVKNLFCDILEATVVAASDPRATVRQYLCEVLDACRDEDQERLELHAPPISAIDAFTIAAILLDYDVVSIKDLPTPRDDPSIPRENRTKPVRQMFEATVNVVLCDRPNDRASLDEIRRLQPGRREETVVYECKEFKDGDWLFLDASLGR